MDGRTSFLVKNRICPAFYRRDYLRDLPYLQRHGAEHHSRGRLDYRRDLRDLDTRYRVLALEGQSVGDLKKAQPTRPSAVFFCACARDIIYIIRG